ncbi:MAG: hypothetical protein F6K28_61545 [Microcoleus sp. SIO2G3]|nr:hypothetical protein [Microcoleus sp. SIO2G3]
MNEMNAQNKVCTPTDVCDVLATAIVLAAQELARVYPQPSEDGINSQQRWTKHLVQCALAQQESMTDEERLAFRKQYFSLQ